MVTHAFNPSTWEAEAGGFLSRLVYRVSSRAARATYTEKPCLEKREKKKEKEEEEEEEKEKESA